MTHCEGDARTGEGGIQSHTFLVAGEQASPPLLLHPLLIVTTAPSPTPQTRAGDSPLFKEGSRDPPPSTQGWYSRSVPGGGLGVGGKRTCPPGRVPRSGGDDTARDRHTEGSNTRPPGRGGGGRERPRGLLGRGGARAWPLLPACRWCRPPYYKCPLPRAAELSVRGVGRAVAGSARELPLHCGAGPGMLRPRYNGASSDASLSVKLRASSAPGPAVHCRAHPRYRARCTGLQLHPVLGASPAGDVSVHCRVWLFTPPCSVEVQCRAAEAPCSQYCARCTPGRPVTPPALCAPRVALVLLESDGVPDPHAPAAAREDRPCCSTSPSDRLTVCPPLKETAFKMAARFSTSRLRPQRLQRGVVFIRQQVGLLCMYVV
ncbi:hypothetical protein NDU88_006811 [Pleurodeles waltl]|uniref:Uncharacterized protein n=1 Tax=Pleurodeles waltl TaxID=8319 RepID=A0AAV7MH29_PLEWA|nr:hypothetical protein NDU88_006811 [Pleurodeles waltl]